MIMGFDHLQIAIPAGGETTARHFYGGILGLTEIPKPTPLADRGGCWFMGPGIQLHLGVESSFRPATKAHPAFLVQDLAHWQRHLDEAGVAITSDASVPHIRRFYAADPFGNRIEFIQDGDGFSQTVITSAQPQGFLAVPPTGEGPGVLVLHAWWGLNDTIKAVCTRLAEAGFVVFAPDLYHGKVAETIADAEALGRALDANHLQAKAEIAEAARFLSERAGQTDRGLAVIGFSLGAYYALDLAAADPEHIRTVVIFYGTGVYDHGNSRASYLGHFAEEDEFEPQSNVDELEESLRRAGRPVTFYRYPGTGHWFFEPDRMQVFNQAAANLAWDRTLAFLKQVFSS